MNIRKSVWNIVSSIYPRFLKSFYGMNVDRTCVISYKAKLDKSINPKGIFIGPHTWVLAEALILSHDHSRSLKLDTVIGGNCIIGVRAIILPGVKLGDHVVVGAGTIVTKNIPSNSVVVGNPGKVIKSGVTVNNKGQILSH